MHDALVEGIVVADDELMERYLEGDIPSVEELEKTLAHGVASATVFPVVCGSATQGDRRRPAGHLHLRDRPVARSTGRPVVVRAGDHDDRGQHRPDRPAPGLGLQDHRRPLRRQDLACSRCCPARSSPTTSSSTPAPTPTRGSTPCSPCGARSRTRSPRCRPATSAAVAKLADVDTGDTLAPKGTPVVVPRPEPGRAGPVASPSGPKSKGDEDKLMTALHRLQEEDPALVVRRNDETHQTLLGGMGETHLAIVTERLARKFGVEVETEDVRRPLPGDDHASRPRPRASTRSRPAATASSAWPSCGSSPSSGATASSSSTQIVGGAIPRQFIPAVQKGIEETMAIGGVLRLPGRRRPGDVLRRQVPLRSTRRR